MTAINHALLGRIWVDHSRKETGGFRGDGYDSHEESPNIEAYPNDGSNAEVRHTTVLQGGYSGYFEVHVNTEARVDSFQKPFEEDGMEYGGVSNN